MCALIIDNKYIIIGGCGLTIFNVKTDTEINILNEPNNISWIYSLYQAPQDNQLTEFRYISDYQDDKLRVFKINIETMEIIMMN